MIWVIIIVLISVMAGLLLPLIVKAILNHALRKKMPGYKGKVDRIKINFFKNIISIHDISIRTDADPIPVNPIAQVPTVTISFKWNQLIRKTLDLNIIVDTPQLFIIAKNSSLEEGKSKNSLELPSLKNSIERLMSFRMNVNIRNGEIQYVHSNPPLNIKATGFNLTINDFSNRLGLAKSCSIAGTCLIYEGDAEIKTTLFPLAPTLTMDLNLELKSLNLVLLNDLIREYGKVDINRGTLDLYAEVVVAENAFKGYIKPLLKNLDFINSADRGDTIFQKIWERIVAGFYNVLVNKRNDQVATKIPIEGRLNDPQISVGVAIVGILRNAFVKALTPSLDNIFNIK